MLKEFWEETSKRGTRIGSIILFPLIFVSYLILAIGYILYTQFNKVLDTYDAIIGRYMSDD